MDSQTKRRSRQLVSLVLLMLFLGVGYWLDRSGAVGGLDAQDSTATPAPESDPQDRVLAEGDGIEDLKITLDLPDVARSDPEPDLSSTAQRDSADESGKQDSRRGLGGAALATNENPDGGELLYGLLREVSRERYLSPEGLLYGPGSAEGHRLEHLKRHIKDDPRRRGSHGVFDGGMEGALRTIDDAYARAKKKQRTTEEIDDDRTIYTVDLGKRIGYVGGSTGKRRGNPMARRVRLVLEGNYVVTAFPL